MSVYSLRIKMGKYQLELSTSDADFVDSQLEQWLKQAGEFARKLRAKEGKSKADSQIKKEAEITRQNIDSQLAKYKPAELPEITEEPESNGFSDSIFAEQNNENSEISENNESLDIFYSPNNNTINGATSGFFDNILEHSIKNPTTELTFKPNPTLKKDNAFLNYISSKKIEKKIDYLLMTAYYFSEYEQKPRFTLKQLNAKLMQNIAVIVDHSVVQEAINRDYIECLPDLTGLIGASEYRLTAYGEKILLED